MRIHQTQIILQGRSAARLLLVLLVGFVLVVYSEKTSVEAAFNDVSSPVVRLTWMSIANWFIEVGDLRIIMNGHITRTCDNKRRPDRECNYSFEQSPNIKGIKAVLKALGNEGVDYILVDHSHVDHSFDAATWSKLTGAIIVGSKTTCYQAFAQGISEDKCKIIDGKKNKGAISLTKWLTTLKVYVVHWHHGDRKSNHTEPKVLIGPPEWNQYKGMIPSNENFPNGGGALAFLFTFKVPGVPNKTLSWFYGGARGFPNSFNHEVCINDEKNKLKKCFGIPSENLDMALEQANLTPKESRVDLYIAYGRNDEWAKVIVPIINPKYYIPHHWDRRQQLFDGIPNTFAGIANKDGDRCKETELEEFLRKHQPPVKFLPQKQYMDAYEMSVTGKVTQVGNERVKQALKLKVENFPPCQ